MLTLIRDRAEIRSSYVSDSTLTSWINSEWTALRDTLIDANPSWFVINSTVSIVNGTDSYSLPSTFYKMVGVDILDSGTRYFSVRPFEFGDRNRYGYVSNGWKYGIRYQIIGDSLYLR